MLGVTRVNQDGIIPHCEQDKMKTLPHITFNVHVSGPQFPSSQDGCQSVYYLGYGVESLRTWCSRVMLTTNAIWCLRNGAILPLHIHAFMICTTKTSLLLYTNFSSLVESLDALESLEARLSRLSGLCGRSSRSLRSKSLSLLSLRSISRSRSLSQSRSLRSVLSRSSCGRGGGGGGGGARGCFQSLSRHSPLSCRPRSREESYSSKGSCLKVRHI